METITKEQIQERIGKLQIEAQALEQQHSKLVADHNQRTQQFQQIATANQNRFQQITGAIQQLTELRNQLNGAEEPKEKT